MTENVSIAQIIAPEDIKPGGYIAVIEQIDERLPVFFPGDQKYQRIEPIRIRRLPCDCGECIGIRPLKVVEVCLPFILVRRPTGPRNSGWSFDSGDSGSGSGGTQLRTLDVRRYTFARLPESYGRSAYRMLKGKGRKAEGEE